MNGMSGRESAICDIVSFFFPVNVHDAYSILCVHVMLIAGTNLLLKSCIMVDDSYTAGMVTNTLLVVRMC